MDRRRSPATMSEQERLRYILECRRRGISYRRIGKALSMSHTGVMYLEKRLTDPESYYGPPDEGEGPRPPATEEW